MQLKTELHVWQTGLSLILAVALGVTKFLKIIDINFVTLCCAT